VRHVAQAKGNRHTIEVIVGKRQLLGIALRDRDDGALSQSRSRPRVSMALLMSVSQTCPPPRSFLAKARARSPVPPATSSTASLRGRHSWRSQRLSRSGAGRPTSDRSSGRNAVPPSRKHRQRAAPFVFGDFLKAEVGRISIAHRDPTEDESAGSMLAAAPWAWWRLAGFPGLTAAGSCCRRGPGTPARAGRGWRPDCRAVPGIQAAVVAVRKDRSDGVVADGLDALDADVALADLQNLLPGPWPRASAEGVNTRRNS
jgi:hypothetical protein